MIIACDHRIFLGLYRNSHLEKQAEIGKTGKVSRFGIILQMFVIFDLKKATSTSVFIWKGYNRQSIGVIAWLAR
jgi:hypothetical protein